MAAGHRSPDPVRVGAEQSNVDHRVRSVTALPSGGPDRLCRVELSVEQVVDDELDPRQLTAVVVVDAVDTAQVDPLELEVRGHRQPPLAPERAPAASSAIPVRWPLSETSTVG